MKKRERVKPEDLANAMHDRVGPTSGRLLGASPIRRVKVGVMWAVRFWRSPGGTASHWLHAEARVGLDRTVRKLFDSRYDAQAGVRRMRMEARANGVELGEATVVRVTFYEVTRWVSLASGRQPVGVGR